VHRAGGTVRTAPGGKGAYATIIPAGSERNRMQGGLMQVDSAHLTLNGATPYWHPVFAVADCDASMAAVTGHGGSVQRGPETSEGVGRLAVCLDPSGAGFVILAPAAG
jgi:uncharacterized protein